MKWQRGYVVVERLLASEELQQVQPNDEHAERLLSESRAHHASATAIAKSDPTGAVQLSYDSARKACAALLAVQGLRATTGGGHRAIQDAVEAQFSGSQGMAVFGLFARMRRQRNAIEYPESGQPGMTKADAIYWIEKAAEIADAATKLMASGKLGLFR
jgi:hypothetical protein